MGMRYNYLRKSGCFFYIKNKNSDSVARFVVLARNLFFLRHNSISFTNIYNNITIFNTLDYTGSKSSFLFQKLIKYKVSFSFPYSLCDNLFCSLCSDTSELFRSNFNFNFIADFDIFINFFCYTN